VPGNVVGPGRTWPSRTCIYPPAHLRAFGSWPSLRATSSPRIGGRVGGIPRPECYQTPVDRCTPVWYHGSVTTIRDELATFFCGMVDGQVTELAEETLTRLGIDPELLAGSIVVLPRDVVEEVIAATDCPWQAQRLDPVRGLVGDPDAGLRMGASLNALLAACRAVQDGES